MMSTPKISIIIPCYNHGVYLRECLEAMKDIQSPYTYEVIVVNDGSTDLETVRIMTELEQEGRHVINQENKGLSAARNTGIKAAQGDLILPLDADNILLADYLNFGITEFEKDDSIGVVYSDLIDFGLRSGPREIPKFDYCRLFKSNYIDACAIYRKDCWKLVEGYDEGIRLGLEDWDMWMRFALKDVKFKHINKYGFKYRVRSDSMLSDTAKHRTELVEYIFSKPEYTSVKWIQDLIRENKELKTIIETREYRVGKMLLKPARVMQRLLKNM